MVNSKLLLFFLFVCGCSFAQTNNNQTDSIQTDTEQIKLEQVNLEQKKADLLSANQAIVENYFQSAKQNTANYEILRATFCFLETPYVGGTLERSEKEELIINLQEMDCMTLVEYSLAMSRAVRFPSPDWDTFARELRQIRYRNGVINGYASRLHYTTDWIYNNTVKGVFEDVTFALGGRKFPVNVHYMSSNYEKYPHLTDDLEAVEQIKLIEKAINTRNIYYYIPKNEIVKHQSKIKNGDIICFTTSISGLDISHLGIAYLNKQQLTFVHASSSAKKVIINPESLVDYCNAIRTCTGIVVLRPVNVPLNE